MKNIFLLTLIAAVFIPASAHAVRPDVGTDTGYFGLYVPRTIFTGEFKALDAWEGAGVRLGFSEENILSSQFSAFKSWHDTDAGSRDRNTFTGMAIDIRLSFPFFPVVAPYGFIGFGRYVLETPDIVYRAWGSGNSYGINGYQRGYGVDIYISKAFSLNLGYTERRIRFEAPNPNGTDFISLRTKASTYDAGFAVHF